MFSLTKSMRLKSFDEMENLLGLRRDEMRTFKINSDEEFFNKFKSVGDKLSRMSYLFQNSDAIVTEEDLEEWNDKWNELDGEIYNLEREAENRVSERHTNEIKSKTIEHKEKPSFRMDLSGNFTRIK